MDKITRNPYCKIYSEKKTDNMLLENSEINIALIDSGVDASHSELYHNIKSQDSYSFINDSSPLIDKVGHGTEVAGILKQVTPQSKIVPYKIIDVKESKADSLNVIRAIIKAVQNGSDIINLSLGTYKNINYEKDKMLIKLYNEAIEYAHNNNVIIVSSLGNNNFNLDYQFETNNIVHLPSYFNNVISIGALKKNQKLASFTNYHEYSSFFTCIGGDFIMQPNNKLNSKELIYTTFPMNLKSPFLPSEKGYSLTAGSSISAAMVTGLIANLLLSSKTTLTIDDIKTILNKSSTINHEYFFNHKISYRYIHVKTIYQLEGMNNL